MSVYVDSMLRPATVPGARPAKWSHLLADTPAELAEFAATLGLQARWLQHAGTHREHYDVTSTIRERALRAGAVAIAYPAGVADLMLARRAVCQCRRPTECRWGEMVSTDG